MACLPSSIVLMRIQGGGVTRSGFYGPLLVGLATFLSSTYCPALTMTQSSESEYMTAPPKIVGGLIELASTALVSRFPMLSADETDIELLLEALHLLCPAKAGIGALDGALCISRGHFDEAIRVLRDVSDHLPRFEATRALLAYSLLMTNDPEWKQYADESLEISPSPEPGYLGAASSACADSMQTLEEAKGTQQSVVPASVTAFLEFNRKAPAAQDVTFSAAITDSAYLIQDVCAFLRA
jgi:type III secretion protein HrpB1